MRRARGYDDEPGWLAREVETLKATVKRRDAGAGVEIRGVSQKADAAQESAVTAQTTATTAQSAAQSAQYAAAQATTQAELAVSAAEQAQADLATAQTQIGGDIAAVVDSVKDGTVFEADTFTGVVMTGALLQTLATASRGIKIIGNDLLGYDDTGDVTFHVDGDTGQVTIAGALIAGADLVGTTLKTATSGLRTEIGNLGGNASTVQFFSGAAAESQPARIEAFTYTQSGSQISELNLRAPRYTGGTSEDAVLTLGRNSARSGAYLRARETSLFGDKTVTIGTNTLDSASEVVITSPKVTVNGQAVLTADTSTGVSVTYDPNVAGIFEGSRVLRRAGMGTLQIEAQNSVGFISGWTLMTVPVGYRPARRQWTHLRSATSAATYLVYLHTNGNLMTNDAIPAGTQLLGAVSGYPLA